MAAVARRAISEGSLHSGGGSQHRLRDRIGSLQWNGVVGVSPAFGSYRTRWAARARALSDPLVRKTRASRSPPLAARPGGRRRLWGSCSPPPSSGY